MWILVSFAIVALVIFLVMILLKIEPIVSMVISVLTGLIIAYFMNHLTITYSEDKYKDNNNDKDKNSTTLSTNSNIATNVPTTHIQSSDSSTANLSNSNSFGFFQSGK